MDKISIRLDTLTVLSLDVEPEEDGSIEFQLHAEIGEVDEEALAALASKKLEPKAVICEVRPRD